MNSDEMNRKMGKIMPYLLLFLLVLSIFFAVKTVGELKNYRLLGSDIRPASIITASGEGEVFAIPDTATFTFSVNEQAETAGEAQEKVTTKMNSIIEMLKTSGIEEKDIKTLGYNLYPRYEYKRQQEIYPFGEQILVGYEASHTLSVKVRELEKAGDLVSKVGQLEVSNISGIDFVSEDEDLLLEEARKLAIDDAQEKAKKLSKDLGVRLGRLIEFSDASSPIYYLRESKDVSYGMGGGIEEAAPIPDLPVGENKIVSQVYLTFEIR